MEPNDQSRCSDSDRRFLKIRKGNGAAMFRVSKDQRQVEKGQFRTCDEGEVRPEGDQKKEEGRDD